MQLVSVGLAVGLPVFRNISHILTHVYYNYIVVVSSYSNNERLLYVYNLPVQIYPCVPALMNALKTIFGTTFSPV